MFTDIERNSGLTIRANINKYMTLHKMNQVALAERLGRSQSSISRMLENAERLPIITLTHIANVLGCSYKDLLEGVF